ncbi:MAG: F0F1 ATP synthase subunit delta [Alphaproteobacteria bacterium]|nr:F0F1 ATP synthase subunit delta [Alphaproteobacteria bacterium]
MSSEAAGVSGLANRYATALFELADEQQSLDSVAADLDGLQAMVEENADFRRMIRSPVLSRDAHMQACAAIATAGGLSGLTGKFLGLLARNRRHFVLPAIIRAVGERLAAHRGEVTAEVTSAKALSDAQLNAIRQALKTAIGSDVSIHPKVEPGLLGGLIVRVGSRMMDNSLRSQLERLKIAMKGTA